MTAVAEGRRARGALGAEDALPFALPAGLAVVWALSTSVGGVPEYVLPGPLTVGRTAWDFITGTIGLSQYSGTFWLHTLASAKRVGLGFVAAAALAVPLGLAAGSSRRCERVVETTIHAVRAVPGIGWLPLAMVWFGIGTKTTVFLIALAAFFPIYVNSAQAAKHVRPIWKRAALMLGAGRRALLTTVVLPATMPSVVSGLRIGLGLSWAYLVLGELSGVPDGLGAVIMDARMMGHTDVIIVGMVSIAVAGRLSDRLLVMLLGRVAWRKEMAE